LQNKEKIDKLLEDLEIKEADIINDLYTVHFKPVNLENRNSQSIQNQKQYTASSL